MTKSLLTTLLLLLLALEAEAFVKGVHGYDDT